MVGAGSKDKWFSISFVHIHIKIWWYLVERILRPSLDCSTVTCRAEFSNSSWQCKGGGSVCIELPFYRFEGLCMRVKNDCLRHMITQKAITEAFIWMCFMQCYESKVKIDCHGSATSCMYIIVILRDFSLLLSG